MSDKICYVKLKKQSARGWVAPRSDGGGVVMVGLSQIFTNFKNRPHE